jgi:aspartate-semialdehyde dehydrogenase
METKNHKIPVAILGATGMVGQRFIQQLASHPWFEITALAGSERSAGRKYREACQWHLEGDMPPAAAEMQVQAAQPPLEGKIVFSALPVEAARQIEPEFAQAGYIVCSNSSAYRYEADIPILIPEINPEHIALLKKQKAARGWDGLLVTSPNCTTTGVVFALKPIHEIFGVEKAIIVSMQAVSGAGYPGLPFLAIHDNVIPLIEGEEKKLELEPKLLLGSMQGQERIDAPMTISAQANRVPVSDGHAICLSVSLRKKADMEEVKRALSQYPWPESVKKLPSAPTQPLIMREEADRPQPRLDRQAGMGMSVSIGRLRPCPILDLRMVAVVHNTLRGAASGSILNAEFLVSEGYIN